MDPFELGVPLHRRWLTRPATIAAAVGVIGAFQYGMWIVQPAAQWRLPLWGFAALFLTLAAILVEANARRQLATWRKISHGQLPATPEHLQKAAAEAYGLNDRIFLQRFAQWTVFGLIIAAVMWFRGMLTWEQTLRVASLGLLIGPTVSLLAYFPMIQRSRWLISKIASRGLTSSQLAQALPQRRLGQRARMVVFALIVAGLPGMMMSDAATTFATGHLERVARIDDASARLAAVAAAEQDLRMDVMLIAGVLLLVAGVIAAAAGVALTDPVRRLAENAREVSEGKFRTRHVIIAEDELWTLASAFSHMQEQLADIIGQLNKAGLQISSTTEQIVITSSKHEQGAARQASALSQTSSTTEELARSAKSIAANAGEVAEIAQRTLDSAEAARANADSFSAAMGRMKQGNEAVASSVQELNNRVGQIGRIVEFINSIADKSDLLALNAELEGVKAGEVGRAFSLVATEMRRMAENVTKSTREIEELIEQIREATSAAVKATEVGVMTTEGSAEIVGAMSRSLETIVQLAGQTTQAVRTISFSTQQQQSGTDQLASAMGDILGVTKETEAATQAIIVANVDLVRLAKEIQAAVSRFRTDAPRA